MARGAYIRAPAVGAFLFLSSFALYLSTLAPTVTFWDSGELIAAANVLGIPHQPGYPLYCLTGRLFSFLPLGNAAFRANLMSALFSSATVAVVYIIVIRMSAYRSGRPGAPGMQDALLGACAAVIVGITRVFWSQAVVAEVYAAGGFIVAMSFLLYVLALDGTISRERYIALSGFLLGLGIVNHVSHVLYLPALMLTWWLAPGPGRGRVAQYIAGVALILLGLSVYLYLPLRSMAGPPLNIGHPESWQGFVWTVRLEGYYNHAVWLVNNISGLTAKLAGLDSRYLATAAGTVVVIAMLVREDARLFMPVALYLVLYTLVVSAQVLGSERDIRFGLPDKFFIPTLIAGAVLAAGFIRPAAFSPRLRRAAQVGAAAVLCASAYLAFVNCHANDRSENFIALDYAENSLKSADERGVLLTWGDNGVFPLWYLHMVERYRDDVVLVHTPLMTYDWYLTDTNERLGLDAGFSEGYFLGENVYRLVKAVTPARTFAYDYSSTRFLELDDTKLTVRGLVYFEGRAPVADPWEYYVFRGLSDPGVFKTELDRNIMEIYRYQAGVSGAVSPVPGY